MGGREGELKRGGIFFFDSFCFLTKQKKKVFFSLVRPRIFIKTKESAFPAPPPPSPLCLPCAVKRDRESVTHSSFFTKKSLRERREEREEGEEKGEKRRERGEEKKRGDEVGRGRKKKKTQKLVSTSHTK